MKIALVLFVGIFIMCCYAQRYPQLQPVVTNQPSYVQPRVGSAATLVLYEDTKRILPWFPGGGLITGGMNFSTPGNLYGSYRNLLAQASAEVYLLDLETSTFMPSIASLNFPRAFHAAFTRDNTAWVWGGGSSEIEYFDPFSNQWIVVPTEGVQPEDRYAFGVTQTWDSLYIFGGIKPTKFGEEVRNDLFVLNFTSMTWSAVNSDTPIWPEARAGCSLDYLPLSNQLVLLGGTNNINNDDGTVFSDMWFFDLEEGTWTKGQDAFPVYDHTTEINLFGDAELLYTFLGVTEDWNDVRIYNVESDQWATFEKSSNEVSPTNNFGFWSLGWDNWVVVGGGVFDEPLGYTASGEIWFLDAETILWNRHECYPGFTFQFPRCVLAETSSCPEYCVSCNDYTVQRELYVSEIEKNLESSEFTGYLRQCPAEWRQ